MRVAKRANGSRAQSAMEYLMTYGWALLVISIILITLFRLGVFGSGSLLGTTCISISGYSCTTPTLSHSTGNLTFYFGESTGSVFYNVAMACTVSSTTQGQPNPVTAMVYLSSSGAATTTPSGYTQPATTLTLYNGQTMQISGLKCFDTYQKPLTSSNLAVGTSYGGIIWINYTLNSGAPGGNNPLITAQFAALTLSAS